MKPSTHAAGSTVQLVSSGTADVKTVAIPSSASAVFLSVEGTDARVTFDGSTPGSANGVIYPAAAVPAFLPVAGITISVASNTGSVCKVNISELE